MMKSETGCIGTDVGCEMRGYVLITSQVIAATAVFEVETGSATAFGADVGAAL